MSQYDPKWAVERRHRVTGEVWYLHQQSLSWISEIKHNKEGKHYGCFDLLEARRLRDFMKKGEDPNEFVFALCLYKIIN